MWLFKIDEFHYCPLGNAGQMKVTNKSKARIRACAILLAGNERCKIYSMPDFTQKMCEMSPSQFSDYVESHGTLLLSQADRSVGRMIY